MKALVILIVFLLVLSITAVGVTHARWDAMPPQVTFNRDFKVLGRAPALTVKVEDPAKATTSASSLLKNTKSKTGPRH